VRAVRDSRLGPGQSPRQRWDSKRGLHTISGTPSGPPIAERLLYDTVSSARDSRGERGLSAALRGHNDERLPKRLTLRSEHGMALPAEGQRFTLIATPSQDDETAFAVRSLRSP